MGLKAGLTSGLAAGSGFGTCRDCSVHACPKHGERTVQFFRCADCIGASAGTTALEAKPDENNPDAVRASAPRLAAGSADLRTRFDAPRMGAAISWIRSRLVDGEPLLVQEQADVLFPQLDGAQLLALESEHVDPEAASAEAKLRAEFVETELRAAVTVEPDDLDGPHSDRMRTAGELAMVGLAITYSARGIDEPDQSPLALRGGLTLPGSVIVIGHAYANANSLFW